MNLDYQGAAKGRYYDDLYPAWVSLADREGALLFIRYGTDFITFGEHATIVAALVEQSAYTYPLGGGQQIGPIFVLSGLGSAEMVTTELMRRGHKIAFGEYTTKGGGQ